ncbi:MAG: hypothetical protein ABH858_07065 [Candidatus Omnitrophota bacterium]
MDCCLNKSACGRAKKKALSLIEIIVVVIIFGLVIPTLVATVAMVTAKIMEAEVIPTSTILARSLLEEIISKRFDQEQECPAKRPCSITLGPDGEAREDFNDVDDFDGLVETDIAGFPGYRREALVYYVDPDTSDYDTAQPDGFPTKYKRIDVKVSHSLLGEAHFSFITSSIFQAEYYYEE